MTCININIGLCTFLDMKGNFSGISPDLAPRWLNQQMAAHTVTDSQYRQRKSFGLKKKIRVIRDNEPV